MHRANWHRDVAATFRLRVASWESWSRFIASYAQVNEFGRSNGKGNEMKKLLVGYDGSGPAREAALMAGRLAKQLGANVTVLTVGEIAPLIVAPTGMFIREAQERDFVPIAEEGAEIVEALGVAAESQVEIGDLPQVVEAVRRWG